MVIILRNLLLVLLSIIFISGCSQKVLTNNTAPKSVVESYIGLLKQNKLEEASRLIRSKNNVAKLSFDCKNGELIDYASKLVVVDCIISGDKASVTVKHTDKSLLSFDLTNNNGSWEINDPLPLNRYINTYETKSTATDGNWEIIRTIRVQKNGFEYEIDRILSYKYVGINPPEFYEYKSNYNEVSNQYLINPKPDREHIFGESIIESNPIIFEDVIEELANYKIVFTWDNMHSELSFKNCSISILYKNKSLI